jgi:hypothetical protein
VGLSAAGGLKPPAGVGDASGDSLHPIDAFLRQTLREHNLTPAPEAAPETLLRRLSWDLTGLPPQIGPAADIDPQTLRDPRKYAAAVDKLLNSPHYGERWARHWLDVVRYADTSGYERDQPKPFAWKYRDWVVHAFNSDLPWSDFVRQQLAGDEIPDRSEQSVIATGLLRLGTWNDEPNDPADYQWERLEDLVHVTSTAFLGLTVKCARCHDHKFDPIPQVDYYRIALAFSPGPLAARDSKLLGGPSTAELGFPEVLGWTDITATPEPLKVLKNGDRQRPLEPVTPGGLSCLSPSALEFKPQTGQRTTGLRLQLADWIVGPASPLACARPDESALAASFRRRPASQCGQFRLYRGPAQPSTTAGLAGRRISSQRRQFQAHASTDADFSSLETVVSSPA